MLDASSARTALQKAKRHGKKEELDYWDSGKHVFLEFIGVADLIDLGSEIDEGEVYYQFFRRDLPMEKRDFLIPPEDRLRALRQDFEESRTPSAKIKQEAKSKRKGKPSR